MHEANPFCHILSYLRGAVNLGFDYLHNQETKRTELVIFAILHVEVNAKFYIEYLFTVGFIFHKQDLHFFFQYFLQVLLTLGSVISDVCQQKSNTISKYRIHVFYPVFSMRKSLGFTLYASKFTSGIIQPPHL